MFYKTIKNVKLTDIEADLEESGFKNVCLTNGYFYLTYDPDTESDYLSAASAISLSDTDDSEDSAGMYLSLKVTFKSKIKATNGKVSNSGKTVTWTVKNASKKKNFYASTTKVTKTAKAASVKSGKTYKSGKKITVKNSNSLADMELDGKTIKAGKKVTKTGSHTLKIWSKNGKVQTVTFKIK